MCITYMYDMYNDTYNLCKRCEWSMNIYIYMCVCVMAEIISLLDVIENLLSDNDRRKTNKNRIQCISDFDKTNIIAAP